MKYLRLDMMEYCIKKQRVCEAREFVSYKDKNEVATARNVIRKQRTSHVSFHINKAQLDKNLVFIFKQILKFILP